MKSTKPSATAFILKSGEAKQSPKKNSPKLPTKKSAPKRKTSKQKAVVAEKKKPLKLSEILKPKNDKNYATFLSMEPRTKLKNILVAQPQPEGPRSAYFDLEAKYKIKFQFTPFVTVEGVSGREFRKQRITLNEYNGIIFTSRNAIDNFFRICEELRVKMSQETKYFCSSEAIALYLQKYTQYRKRKVFFSDTNSNKEMRALLLKHKETTRNLYICPEVRSKDEITSFMSEQKITFAEAVMYRTVPSDLSKVDFKKYDMMILFSPSAIHSLYKSVPNFKQDKTKIGVYGKFTADAVMDAKLNIHIMAPLDGVPSIIAALDNYLKESNK